jgi:hypothetical protein
MLPGQTSKLVGVRKETPSRRDTLDLPSELRAGGARRQVFGLAGERRGAVSLLASLPSSRRSQCYLTRSFPITAAGQSRIRTGFPLMAPDASGGPTQCRALYWCAVAVVKTLVLFLPVIT